MRNPPRTNFRLSRREQVVFYAMTLLTIIGLVSTATFRHRTTDIVTQITNTSRNWNNYLDLLATLESSAGAVNAPGNDVFDSRDVQNERFRFHFLHAQFEHDLTTLRQAIAATMAYGALSEAQEILSAVEQIEKRMASATDVVLERFEAGRLGDAAKSMAEMDKHYAEIRRKLGELRKNWAAAANGYAEQQMGVIDSLKNANAFVMAVNLLFILGFVISGHRMFHRLKESNRELITARNEAVLARQIKARFAANLSHEIRTPPIVPPTASAYEEDRTKCLDDGMDDMQAGPPDLDILQRMLQRWGRADETGGPTGEADECARPSEESEGSVDVAVLLEGFAGMERNLAIGIGTFLHDAPVVMSRLRKALQARDCAKLSDAAHGLGGTAAMFRATAAARLCAELERQGREGNLDRAASLFRALEAELEQVRGQMTLLKVHCQNIASRTPSAHSA